MEGQLQPRSQPQDDGLEQPDLQQAQVQQPQNQQSQPRRRRRPALSCHECRRRKIKCDQKSPCAHCGRQKTQCTYQLLQHDEAVASTRRPRASAPPSPGSRTPSTLRVADQPLSSHSVAESQGQQQLPPAILDSHSRSGSAIGASHRDHPSASHGHVTASHSATVTRGEGGPAPASSSNGHVHGHGHDVLDLLERTHKHEQTANSQAAGTTSSHSKLSESGQGTFKRQHPDPSQDWQMLMNKSRDMGKGGRTELAEEFGAIIACWGEIMGKPSNDASFRLSETATLVAEAGDFLRQCKHTAKSIKLARPTRGNHPPLDLLTPGSREVSDTMANLYFESFESTHRILHLASFWTDYRRYWDYPETATAGLRLTVLLVIGIGSSLSDQGTPEAALRNAELVHQWIYAAETWLAGPLEKDRVDLAGLQLYCLTILARQIFSIGGDTVWMSMGSLIHRAMQIGLHRDPQNLPCQRMPVLQAEVRRRLWATILELVVQASLDSRMPPRISFDEFDTRSPSNVNDAEIDESTTVVPCHPPGHFTGTSIQLALLSSIPARLRILRLLNGLNAERSYHWVLELSSELTDALRANGDLMKNKHESTPFQRNLLDYLVRRFVIPLHLSFSNQARTNTVYYYSLKLSLDAATAIMSPEHDAGFSRLMASGGGMFREGLRVATLATCLELLVHVQAQRLDGTLQRTSQYRDFMKQAVRNMVLHAEERIRHGETNVKTHMYLSMVLAQVEAIESELPVELQLARSARDSLEYCYSILKTRAEDMSSAATPAASFIAVGMECDQGLESYSLDLDWESFIPDQALFSETAL